jgi:hypothetical protein
MWRRRIGYHRVLLPLESHLVLPLLTRWVSKPMRLVFAPTWGKEEACCQWFMISVNMVKWIQLNSLCCVLPRLWRMCWRQCLRLSVRRFYRWFERFFWITYIWWLQCWQILYVKVYTFQIMARSKILNHHGVVVEWNEAYLTELLQLWLGH